MEIEASILPVRIRFDKICKNYAFRTIQLDQEHPIKKRTPDSFPNGGELEIEWDKYLDWNQEDSSNKKKYPTQLIKVLGSISTSVSSLNIEKSGFKKVAPWLTNPITFPTKREASKEQIVLNHTKEIEDILLQNSIIGYSDGSKLDSLDTGAGIYLIDATQFPEAQSEHSYYLGRNMEVYDAELIAILKTL
jgi:hypothetical protein